MVCLVYYLGENALTDSYFCDSILRPLHVVLFGVARSVEPFLTGTLVIQPGIYFQCPKDCCNRPLSSSSVAGS